MAAAKKSAKKAAKKAAPAKKAAAKEVEANKGDCQEGRSCRQGGTGEYTRIWHRVHDPSAAVSCPVGQRTLAHPLN